VSYRRQGCEIVSLTGYIFSPALRHQTYIYCMEKQKSITGLLPNYFKVIGVVFLLLAFVPMIVMKAADIKQHSDNKELYRMLTMNAFILGLLLIAWSRDKFEDKVSIALRLKTMRFSFLFGVLTIIIEPLCNRLFGLNMPDVSGPSLVVTMLLIYLMMYYLQKKAVKNV